MKKNFLTGISAAALLALGACASETAEDEGMAAEEGEMAEGVDGDAMADEAAVDGGDAMAAGGETAATADAAEENSDVTVTEEGVTADVGGGNSVSISRDGVSADVEGHSASIDRDGDVSVD